MQKDAAPGRTFRRLHSAFCIHNCSHLRAGATMKHIAALVVFIAVTVTPDMMGAQNRRAPFRPVADAMLEKPDPANWPMWRRTLDSWGFSPLDHVNRSNVSQLRMVWSRAMGPGNVQEATPLVYDGVMYVPNPNDYITAFEADTGRLLWEYRRELPQDLG